MKAIVITRKGGPEVLCMTEYPRPSLEEGMVLIRVRAFGINRAEVYMRKGQWGETTDIIGIEGVGTVEEDGSGRFTRGQKVAAVCGGMSRTLNGSYAEYTLVPWTNVVALETDLPWDELAAIPESYMTAWAILNWGLDLRRGDNLLIRGGSSTLGQACLLLARQAGFRVLATTRSARRSPLLKSLGAEDVLIDDGGIAASVRRKVPAGADHVIELIGTSTLADSLSAVGVRGGLCLAGFLGGMEPLASFQPLLQIPSGLRFTTFGSAFVFGQKGYEVTNIPLQHIVTNIEKGHIPNIHKKTFRVEEIAEAHRLVESNGAEGKVVVEWA
jgi:NADPH:quinone reductase-like Zn-dependent oxidoreductase